MLNAIIRFALRQRLLILALSLMAIGLGAWRATEMEVDVFPNLNRPRVVVMTEAPGMAPEEVEALITFPLETALNGASGVEAVRSSSGVGISVIYVEFDWGTNILDDRQIVNERLQLAQARLPPGIQPQLAPISSIMGQIVMIGMWSEGNKTGPLELRTIADWDIRRRLLKIPGVSQVFVMGGGRMQFQVLVNPDALLQYGVTLHDVERAVQESNQNATGGYLDQQGPKELLVRSLGRIRNVDDLKKVVVKIRDRRPVTLTQVARIVKGPQVKRGDSSAFVRVEGQNGSSPSPDSRPSTLGPFSGGQAVVLTINKQPNADTRAVTDEILKVIKEVEGSLPDDVRIQPDIYSQKSFIDRAIDNVKEALADGGVLVVIILFLFLMNFRTTFITLTAIPLSIMTTALVFTGFGLTINTMTLGGIAVAIGELVDDAIVDVENIFRRLRENRSRDNPKHPLLVIFQASVEIRKSIVFGTMIVVLVFIPLFFLTGIEGRLFAPLGVAYIVSILSSLLVSLTVTPVLSYWLLAKRHIWPYVAPALAVGMSVATFYWILPRLSESLDWPWLSISHPDVWSAACAPIAWLLIMASDLFSAERGEGYLLRGLKFAAGHVISLGMRFAIPILVLALFAVIYAGFKLSERERDFLPPFNEGAVQLNLILPPGTSLKTSNEIARMAEKRLMKIEDIEAIGRRTGRAELDEHAEGVNMSELILHLNPNSTRSRKEQLDDIRQAMKDIPGVDTSVEQPISHLISHMLSGVKAQVGIKVFGDDLDVLRRKAAEIKAAIQNIDGVKDLMVEPQAIIPQLRIELNRDMLKQFGMTPVYVNEYIQTAMNGKVVSTVLIDQKTFDLLVRMDKPFREDLNAVRRLSIDLPEGGTTPLQSIATIYESGGPNTINREQVQRRIVIQCNVSGRGLVDTVEEIKQRLRPIEDDLARNHRGYYIEYGGQFESQRSASRVILIAFLISLGLVFLVLHSMFGSASFSLQVMAALPMAFIGSVAALYLTDQTLTIASMVGFISLGGIASRNGILLLNHYVHLVKYEGETWSKSMIIRAGKERLAPVLMTALTSGIGLVPLAMAAGEPGKEILYPVATVIIGGLISSTLLEFLLRPALFWTFGVGAGRRLIEASGEKVKLIEEELETGNEPA